VAYFGTFGYELDLNLLSDAEMEKVKEQIRFMKEYRNLIQVDGDFYRLRSPFEGNDTAWMVVSQDKKDAVAAYYQRLNKVNASWLRFKLSGLEADTLYEVSCDVTPIDRLADFYKFREQIYGASATGTNKKVFRAYGDELMQVGIVIDREDLSKKGGDFASLLYLIHAVEE
jgi:alpha-galactosidase